MFDLKMAFDVEGVKRELTVTMMAKVPDAMALALSSTGQDVKKAQETEIGRIFDRPTPFTRRAIRMWPATRDKLKSVVWLRDDKEGGLRPSNYLTPNIDGGGRKLKRSERLLTDAGILPAGWRTVPAQGARFDSYGNISSGQIVQILSYLKTFRADSKRSNMTDAKRDRMAGGRAGRSYGRAYLVVSPNGSARTRHLTPGVYEQIRTGFGTAIRPVLIFVSRARYRGRWRFDEIGDKVISDRYTMRVDQALTRVMGLTR